jgi:hypothetical protein
MRARRGHSTHNITADADPFHGFIRHLNRRCPERALPQGGHIEDRRPKLHKFPLHRDVPFKRRHAAWVHGSMAWVVSDSAQPVPGQHTVGLSDGP